jgi:hypothetical protein
MSYRPFPNRDRARKYAVLHGKPLTIVDLAPLLATADFPPDDGRIRQLVDSLPTGTIQFSSWFPAGPVRPGEEPTP